MALGPPDTPPELVFSAPPNDGETPLLRVKLFEPGDFEVPIESFLTWGTKHCRCGPLPLGTFDVFVDAAGLIYSTDYNGGLYILEYGG